MKKAITDRVLKSLKPLATAYEVRDQDLGGYLARVQPSGLIVFYCEYRNEAGKRNRIKLGRYPALSAPRAREAARALLAGVSLGADPAAERRQARDTVASLTLREYIDGPYRAWAESNLKSHKQTLSRLFYGFETLLDRNLDSLTAFDFEKNRQARLKSKPKSKGKRSSPTGATINRDAAHLRAAFTRAMKWGYMAVNPLTGITKSVEDRNAKIRALTDDEEVSILAEFQARRDAKIALLRRQELKRKRQLPKVPRYVTFLEPAFIVSVDCGVRRGELLGLLWKDVDFDGRAITVQGAGSKSSQSRMIPLSTRAHMTLAKWKTLTRGQGRVFPKATADGLKAQWKTLLRDTKIKALRWHDLRHTFGSRLAQAGVPVTTIQRLMGHSSIVTTQRYLHVSAEDARRGIEMLEKAAGDRA